MARLNIVHHDTVMSCRGHQHKSAGWPGISVSAHGWSGNDLNIGNIAQRNLLLHWGQDWRLSQHTADCYGNPADSEC